jgi:hypothetical protein
MSHPIIAKRRGADGRFGQDTASPGEPDPKLGHEPKSSLVLEDVSLDWVTTVREMRPASADA